MCEFHCEIHFKRIYCILYTLFIYKNNLLDPKFPGSNFHTLRHILVKCWGAVRSLDNTPLPFTHFNAQRYQTCRIAKQYNYMLLPIERANAEDMYNQKLCVFSCSGSGVSLAGPTPTADRWSRSQRCHLVTVIVQIARGTAARLVRCLGARVKSLASFKQYSTATASECLHTYTRTNTKHIQIRHMCARVWTLS